MQLIFLQVQYFKEKEIQIINFQIKKYEDEEQLHKLTVARPNPIGLLVVSNDGALENKFPPNPEADELNILD